MTPTEKYWKRTAEESISALKKILEICGTVNHSSFNQMKEAVTSAVDIADVAIAKSATPPAPADCGCMGLPINGPFVCSKGCYEMLIQKRTPTPPPPCCARWVSIEEVSSLRWLLNIGKERPKSTIGVLLTKRFDKNGVENVKHLENLWSKLENHFHCTCQQVALPTREEAEEWADTSYPGDDIFAIGSRNYMMAMYDWIAERFNKPKK